MTVQIVQDNLVAIALLHQLMDELGCVLLIGTGCRHLTLEGTSTGSLDPDLVFDERSGWECSITKTTQKPPSCGLDWSVVAMAYGHLGSFQRVLIHGCVHSLLSSTQVHRMADWAKPK